MRRAVLCAFGIVLGLLCVEASLRLGGYLLSSIQRNRNHSLLKQKGDVTILCIGESTTAGQYPRALQQILNEKGGRTRFTVIDKGVVATDTDRIVRDLRANLDTYAPDIVVLMMGINDYRFYNDRDILPYYARSGLPQRLKLYRLYMYLKSSYRGNTGTRPGDPPPAFPPSNVSAAAGSSDRSDTAAGEILSSLYRRSESCMRSGDHIGALRLLKQALDVPENLIDTRLRLGLLYRKLQRSPHGEEDLKTAIRLLPGETMAAYRLGELYLRQGRTQEAYRMFTACIRREPSLMLAYIGLSQALLKMGDYEGSVEVFRKAMRSYPYDDRFYGCMAIHYLRLKDHARADEYFRAAKAFQLDYLNPITCRNYSLTLAELKKRNIPAVCMQYPLRSIEPLKRMVPDTGDVIFVDNESNFREALKTHPFEYYFRDQFGGDFGHCTWKGNELIAENLARRILEELPARGHPH